MIYGNQVQKKKKIRQRGKHSEESGKRGVACPLSVTSSSCNFMSVEFVSGRILPSWLPTSFYSLQVSHYKCLLPVQPLRIASGSLPRPQSWPVLALGPFAPVKAKQPLLPLTFDFCLSSHFFVLPWRTAFPLSPLVLLSDALFFFIIYSHNFNSHL